MKILLSILLSMSAVFSSSAFHPLHVSVCEIKHDAAKEWLEITIKIFEDDFRDVLKDRNGIATKMGTEEEHVQTDGFIFEYLQEKIQISINGEAVELQYIGKEIEDVASWCYLYVPDVKKISSIEISNAVMVDWFDDQVNVTHVDCNNKLKSTFFSKDRLVDKFEYK